MNRNNINFLIKTIGLFLVVSFVVDKVAYYSLKAISDKVYTGESIGKLNHYLSLKDTVDLIVFGSSRADRHVNVRKLAENSYNIGVHGRIMAYPATLTKFLPKEKKQTVLFHLDPFYAFQDSYDGDDINALNTEYNRNPIIRKEINRIHKNNLIQYFYWSISYNSKAIGIIINYLRPKYNYKTYSGYDPLVLNEKQKEKFIKSIENLPQETCIEVLKLNPVFELYLDDLKELSKTKKVIVFTSPVYRDDCKNDNQTLAEIMKQKGLVYYDYSDFFKDNNSYDYWKDQGHMAQPGAELFTDELKKVIE